MAFFRSYFPLSATIFCAEPRHKRISASIGAKNHGHEKELSQIMIKVGRANQWIKRSPDFLILSKNQLLLTNFIVLLNAKISLPSRIPLVRIIGRNIKKWT